MEIKRQTRNKRFEDLIEDVVAEGLCLGCGTCVAVCPSGLVMKANRDGEYVPYIKELSCIGCGFCYTTCPGRNVPYDELANFLPDSKKTAQDCLLGIFRNIYVGFSTDSKLRCSASSGGIVSSILTFLLEKHLINGAIVTGMDRTYPWKAKTKIATRPEEVYDAKQSKYVVVPTNSLLQGIRNVEGTFVLVALPCQIHGLKNIARYTSDTINDKIPIKIGLFCGSNIRTTGLGFLLKRLGITDSSTIQKLEYRGGNYPGGFLISLLNGKHVFVKRYYFSLLSFLFSLHRCSLCPDLTNELADISVGDVSLGDLETPMGTIITRTKKGEDIVSGAVSEGYIRAYKIHPDRIVSSNLALLISKKKGSYVRMALRERKRLKNPESYLTYMSFEPSVLQVLYELSQSLLRGRVLSWVLKNSPLCLSLSFARVFAAITCSLSLIIY